MESAGSQISIIDSEASDRSLIEGVAKVQDTLAVFSELSEQGTAEAPRGLLISGYTPQVFRDLVSRGGTLYVAANGPEVNGYLLQLPGKKLASQLQENEVRWLDYELAAQAQQKLKGGDYAYLDQIGVSFGLHGRSVSHQLLQAFEKRSRRSALALALIMTAPIRNVRSLGFFRKHGYDVVGEVKFERFGLVDGFEGFLVAKRLGA